MIELQLLGTGKSKPSATATPRRASDRQHKPLEPENANVAVEYLRMLVRRRWWILGAAVVGAVLGIGVTLPVQPLYQASTSLEVKNLNEDFLDMRAVNPTSMPASGDSGVSTLQTEIKLLQSKSMLDRTARRVVQNIPSVAVEPSDLISRAKRRLGWRVNTSEPLQQMVLKTAKSVTVKPMGMTRLLEVRCQSSSAALAAAFCNSLADEYINSDLEERGESARKTSAYLASQLQDVRLNLERAEQQLQSYAQQTTLLSSGDKEGVAQERLRELQTELSSAQADRILKQAQYELTATATEQTLPPVLDNGPLREYETQLSKLQQQHAELSALFTPDYSKVKRLQAQITDLEQTISKERENIVARIKNEFSAAKQREGLLRSAYQGQSAQVASLMPKETQYNMALRDVEAERQLYATLLERAKEAGLISGLHSTPVRVVDRAEQPQIPVAPRQGRSMITGLLVGGFGGALLAFFKDRTDRKLNQPGEVTSRLRVRELGVIPAASVDRPIYTNRKQLPGMVNALVPRDRMQFAGRQATAGLELVTWANQGSLMAESYRSVMSSLLYFDTATQQKARVVVSSPSIGEGKTTLISNLAIALAQTNRSVVIVDGDMRRPRIHKIFNVEGTPGLSSVLNGEIDPAVCSLDRIAKPTGIPNLFVLPSGPALDNPASSLFSPNLAALVDRLHQEFDFVLMDSPPMLHLSDARALARMADGVILVIRAGSTNRDDAQKARQILEADGTHIYGVVLNDFDPGLELDNKYYSSYHRYQKGG